MQASINPVIVAGDLSFSNFSQVREQVSAQIRNASEEPVFCDLSGLTSANSLGAVLMMALTRLAHQEAKSLVFVKVPRDLRNIIDFSGLADVLPLDEQATAKP